MDKPKAEDAVTDNPYEGKPAQSLIAELFDVRRTKSAAEKSEKQIMVILRPQVDGKFDGDPKYTFTVGGLVLSRVPGHSSSVDPQALLDKGVAPDVIAACTKRTSYFQYRVGKKKDSGGNGNGGW